MPYLYQGQKSSVVFMLPGQGSQFYQMGYELYQNNTVFHHWMNELDKLIQAELGDSIITEIYHHGHARAKTFDDIRLTHPAIFMTEYALGKTLMEQGIAPDYLLGASLGEVTAAALADALSLSDAVWLTVKQGELFHQQLTAGTVGGMLAILANASLYQQTPLLHAHCEMAAYNADDLIVIAGPSARITDVEDYLRTRDIVFQRLAVKQAFHSRYIDDLKPEIDALTRQLDLAVPRIALISCYHTSALNPLSQAHFWHTIRQPIRFSQTLARLEEEATLREESLIYLDLGPSGTLANLAKQNLPHHQHARILPVLSPFGRDLEKFDEVRRLGQALETRQPAVSQAISVKQASTGPKQVYLFPGQGSQRLGMGAALFEQFPDYLARADDILGYSLKTLCLEDPDQQLSHTQYTQPALYTVSALAFLDKQQQNPRKPDFLAGHSLGEYSALFAAGAFSFETGLRLVKKRGELMARATGGGMAAVIGQSPNDIHSLLSQYGLNTIDVANYNSQNQVVLAGPMEALSDAKEIFQKQDITFIPLPVSAPFHSRYMQRVMAEFDSYLRQFSYTPLHTPVIANIDAQPYRDDQLIDKLTRQICGSVQWLDTIQYLIHQGECVFEELGPGNVLSKLVNSICSSSLLSSH